MGTALLARVYLPSQLLVVSDITHTERALPPEQIAGGVQPLPQELLALADRLRRSGMAAPIGFLLAAHRPLRGVASLCEDAVAPLFRALLGSYAEPLYALMKNAEQFDRFVALLLGELSWEE